MHNSVTIPSQIAVDVTVRLDASPELVAALTTLLQSFGDSLMSKLSDAIAAASASADAATARVQGDVTALREQVATLQATIDAGGATQADLDAIAALQAKLDALDPSSPAVLPTDPAAVVATG